MNNPAINNVSKQIDFIFKALKLPGGGIPRYYITKDSLLNKTNQPNRIEGILNHVISPMGSGKSTAILDLYNQLNPNTTLIIAPFIVTSKFYSNKIADGYLVKNILHLTTTIFNQATNVIGGVPDYQTGMGMIERYIENTYRGWTLLMDDIDYVWDQCTFKNNTDYSFRVHDNYCINIDTNVIVQLVLKTLCKVCTFNLSVSSHKFNYPDDSLINEFMMIGPVNVEIKNLFIYDTTGRRGDTVNLSTSRFINNITTNKDHLLGVDTKVLIYTPKFKKGSFEQLIQNGPRNGVLVRRENIPKSAYLNPREYSNLMLIGNSDAVLSDELFKEFDVMGINTSSSRCISLTKKYENFWIIIIQPNGVTSSCLQSLGRVSNCGVNVLWIGNTPDINTWYENCVRVDPFFNQYCNVNTNIRYINTLTCPYGIRGLNKPVSRVGERIGDAIGDAIGMNNQVTLEVNRLLIEWLEANRGNLKGSLKDYEVYKVQVVNPCGSRKFQEYHSICKKGGSWS